MGSADSSGRFYFHKDPSKCMRKRGNFLRVGTCGNKDAFKLTYSLFDNRIMSTKSGFDVVGVPGDSFSENKAVQFSKRNESPGTPTTSNPDLVLMILLSNRL